MIITSKGKRHINGYKELTAHNEVVDLKEDKEVASLVYFPLICPNGKDVKVAVKEGAKVKVGTKLMVRNDFDIPVYCSVSGIVKGKEMRYSALLGKSVEHLVIENDYKYSVKKLAILDYMNASKEEIVNAIKDAGIVGLGGAGFPTYIKYNSNAEIKSVLVNAVECEPFLTTDYVTMMKEYDFLFKGIEILKKASGANEAIIAFKNNKKDLKELLDKELVNYKGIKIVLVQDKYPMGWEKALIKDVYKKTYKGLPSEVGVIVNNAQTVISVAKAILNGECISSRVVTVSGNAIKEPKNVIVPIGTIASEILNKCGGVSCDNACLLPGGPMTSKSAINDEFPIYLTHGALTIMEELKIKSEACLRCGKCIANCPAGLQPIQIKNAYDVKDLKELEDFQANKCVECGMCSYICPSKIELTDAIKKAKLYLRLSQTKR